MYKINKRNKIEENFVSENFEKKSNVPKNIKFQISKNQRKIDSKLSSLLLP